MNTILELLQYGFMQRAVIAGICVGLIAPLIGIFLVVKRYSLLGDTLAHLSLLGVAAGMLWSVNPYVSAMGISSVGAVVIERLRSRKKIFGESVLAIFLSGSLAIAVILISMARTLNFNFYSYLFGNISTVQVHDLYIILPLSACVVFLFHLFYKKFFVIAFDEELAAANGLAVKRYNTLLMLMSAVAISVAMRVVGALLVGALMVIPVTSALQYRKSFKKTLYIAIFFAEIAIIVGIFVSFHFSLPSGGAIVLVSLILFVMSLFARKD